MPPVSRAQQKLVFARARAGVAWAQRWVAEGNMDIQPNARHKRKARRAARHARRRTA